MKITLDQKKTEHGKSETPDSPHHVIQGVKSLVQLRMRKTEASARDQRAYDGRAGVIDQHCDDRKQLERASGESVFRSDETIFTHVAIIALQIPRVKRRMNESDR